MSAVLKYIVPQMKLFLLCAALVLSGCATKHYQVCMAAEGGDAGCSHTRFTKKGATDLGKLIQGEPIQEEIHVWVIDTRKHKTAAPKTPKAEPNSDPKI